jgi:chorismate mutase-like protein
LIELESQLPLRAGLRFPRLPRLPWGGSSVGRASRSQCEGRGFDPLPLHHFFPALFLALLLPTAAAAAVSVTWEQVRARGVLRIGTPGDYAPYAVRDRYSGSLVGSDIVVGRRLALELGLRAEFVPTTWKGLLDDAAAGKFDVALGGISITAERARVQRFSRAYASDHKVPVTRCGEQQRFDTRAEINRPEVRLIVNQGGTNESFSRRQFPAAALTVHPDNLTVFDEIAAGRADVMVTDSVEAQLRESLGSGLCHATTKQDWAQARKAIMLAPDPEFQDAINHALDRTNMSDTYLRLRGQWTDQERLASAGDSPALRLARLADLRLTLMTEVARWKWNRQAAIEDLPRERAQLESLRARALAAGVSPESVDRFFGAQINAAKQLQFELFDRWRREQTGAFNGVLELDADLRPEIDRVTTEMLGVLARWNGAAAPRESLGAMVMEPISPATVNLALRPLVGGS